MRREKTTKTVHKHKRNKKEDDKLDAKGCEKQKT